MAEPDLLLYPGILVNIQVPRDCDTAALDEALARIRLDIEGILKLRLPKGCVGRLQTIA